MKYWKIVDAGNYSLYTLKLFQYYWRQYDEYFYRVNDFWNPLRPKKLPEIMNKIPELGSLENNFGSIRELTILVLNGDSSTLHTDHDIGRNRGVRARLNIPVLNCAGSTTAFFEIPTSLYHLYRENEGKTKTWPQELRNILKPVTQVDLLQPTILRISEPHTVFCHSCNFPRISLTVSFEKDIVHLLDQ